MFMLVVQGPEAFWEAQEKIYRVLEEQFYPAFLLSDLFHSYTKTRSIGVIATFLYFFEKYSKLTKMFATFRF